MTDYRDFVAGKHVRHVPVGFKPDRLPKALFDWQHDIVGWACRVGRCGLYEDTGLGKTAQQLAWADAVHRHTGESVLILAPLAVGPQTVREAAKFGIESPIQQIREQADAKAGLSVCNYERLHLIDAKAFVGVVLDESAILKNFTGTRKRQLMDSFAGHRFRLACSATPAPNEWLELGNQCDWLGVMPANEMIARWFTNNTMKAGDYRLRMHGAEDYWRWVSSWAVALSRPSDLGAFSDAGYDLPDLNIVFDEVHCEEEPSDGWLIRTKTVSATTMHSVKRATSQARAERVGELLADGDCWIVWCDTDYDADALKRSCPGTIEVRGSMPAEKKERLIDEFSTGQARAIITKPEICGMGLNWQHCHKIAFCGLTFSFERFYQAIRRSWRFGQTKPVEVHLVLTEADEEILGVVKAKELRHKEMQAGMVQAMRSHMRESLYGRVKLRDYTPDKPIQIPAWLQTEMSQ